MRLLVVVFLIGSLLLQVFSKTIIYAGFIANREYIAKNLCENRAVPEKNCCGKCQLEKRMDKDEAGQDQNLHFLFKSLKEVQWVNEQAFSFSFQPTLHQSILFPSYNQLSRPGFSADIFRPPCFLLT